MSNIKISQLPVATSLTGAEAVPLVQSGGTVQVAVSVFVDYLQDPGYFRAFSGTVSEVSYGFKNTPDTGIYSPAPGQLGLVTVGTERLRIDTSGNVGIGMSAPTAKLDIYDAAGAGNPTVRIRDNISDLRLYPSGGGSYVATISNTPLIFNTNSTERLRVDPNGNVGIGTSLPGSFGRLAVSTPAASFGLFGIANSAGGGGGVQLANYFSSAKISYIDVAVTNGTPGSETASMAFATINNGSLAERMRIESNGNVGIGTNSPQTKLDIYDSAGAGNPAVRIRDNASDLRLYPSGGASYIGTVSNTPLIFNTNNTERVRINATGIGIGLSSYSLPLSVAADGNGQNVQINGRTGDDLGQLFFRNFGGANNLASITSDNSATLRFGTGSQTAPTVPTERMRLNATGMGIGLTSYGLPLAVVADGNGQNVQLNGRTGDDLVQLFFRNFSGANNLASITSGSGGALIFGTGSQTAPTVPTERMRIDASGNVRVGTAALATTAIDGFLYIPTCPGTPTGTPTAITGLAPIVINSTNNKLYFYSGGVWRDAGP